MAALKVSAAQGQQIFQQRFRLIERPLGSGIAERLVGLVVNFHKQAVCSCGNRRARNGRDVDGTPGIDGEDVKAIRQAMIGLAESQFDWRSGPPPESFIAGIEDNCGPNRPHTEDIDCNFEPLVDVGAINP